ncbi:lipopolysaccharide transport periplasmic protein LptA [Shewanella woodyi]|uniref:Lipopolysaccharide export system protein LptA n=1 Tax=Shewanella woodyi (strain ATCC 51908 / MS32) TaxID=392500 RepID=B1KIJ8_SHEWM|nr:lipopolysaccharide transport periplasmic protein LptA [Shewanella woodyi]ACA88494.1 lipopolysaccharide transport periplasmic protein LptA [Shewanella woodyi ATCC 51908]
MKQNTGIITALLCLISFSSVAKVDDLKQEVKISAASQEADIKNNQIIFNGPVEVVQGSVKINADKLRAFTKEGSNGRILVATGNPATYSQIMEDGRPANASAKEIRYELSKRTLILKGNATLEQDGSQVTGNQIQYNIEKQQLIAESTGSERVITIIQPENYQDESKPKTDSNKETQPETKPEIPVEPAVNAQEIE